MKRTSASCEHLIQAGCWRAARRPGHHCRTASQTAQVPKFPRMARIRPFSLPSLQAWDKHQCPPAQFQGHLRMTGIQGMSWIQVCARLYNDFQDCGLRVFPSHSFAPLRKEPESSSRRGKSRSWNAPSNRSYRFRGHFSVGLPGRHYPPPFQPCRSLMRRAINPRGCANILFAHVQMTLHSCMWLG